MPLLYDLRRKLLKREFGSDLLGGISIITSVVLGEYLAGSIIVVMLAGGEALESDALRSASSVAVSRLKPLGILVVGPPRRVGDAIESWLKRIEHRIVEVLSEGLREVGPRQLHVARAGANSYAWHVRDLSGTDGEGPRGDSD